MDFREGFLVAAILLLGFIAFLMASPFIGYILGAALLAFVLFPLHRKLRKNTGKRISAMLLVLASIFLAIVPVIIAGGALLEDARDLSTDFNRTDLVNTTELEQQFQRYTGRSLDVEEEVSKAIGGLTAVTTGGFSRVVAVALNMLLGISLMVFLLYYLLKDGEKLVVWLKDIIPLPKSTKDELHENINRMTWAVIKGHVLIAILQGVVGGVGLALAGVPNYIFWTFVMILLGFIPVVGAFLVWMPASVYLLVIDRPGAALFLLIYGTLVTGSVDNFLRPIIVERGAKINPAVILIGVLGGVYLFGAVGLFIGPVILGILKAILKVFQDNYSS